LGIDKSQIEKLFGKPSSMAEIGDYGHKWVYDKTNFSLEVSTKGRLSSIKILDNSQDLFPSNDLTKIPTFDKIQTILNSTNNENILNLLSGDIEVYKNDSTYFFKKSFATEQSTDYSNMISLIKSISKDLAMVNTKKEDEYEENIRVALGVDAKHVIKIKKGHLIKEIVLKYYGGKYLIYEINANSK
jgi:hypothetical protein